MAKTYLCKFFGCIKEMVANFWFLFIFMEVLFKGKVVGNKRIYIFYTLTINKILLKYKKRKFCLPVISLGTYFIR